MVRVRGGHHLVSVDRARRRPVVVRDRCPTACLRVRERRNRDRRLRERPLRTGHHRHRQHCPAPAGIELPLGSLLCQRRSRKGVSHRRRRAHGLFVRRPLPVEMVGAALRSPLPKRRHRGCGTDRERAVVGTPHHGGSPSDRGARRAGRERSPDEVVGVGSSGGRPLYLGPDRSRRAVSITVPDTFEAAGDRVYRKLHRSPASGRREPDGCRSVRFRLSGRGRTMVLDRGRLSDG